MFQKVSDTVVVALLGSLMERCIAGSSRFSYVSSVFNEESDLRIY